MKSIQGWRRGVEVILVGPDISCVFPSSDGWSSLELRVRDSFVCETTLFLRLHLAVQSQYWDRMNVAMTNRFDGGLQEDYVIRLPQVIVPRDRIVVLMRDLNRWREQQGKVRCDLTSSGDQALSLSVGPHGGFVSERGKDVLLTEYRSSRCNVQTYFMIDQSCVMTALEEMKRLLTIRS